VGAWRSESLGAGVAERFAGGECSGRDPANQNTGASCSLPRAMSFARMEPYLGVLEIISVLVLHAPSLATLSLPKLRRSDGFQTAPVAKLEVAARNVGDLCQVYVYGH
jgi:hypothetical protein